MLLLSLYISKEKLRPDRDRPGGAAMSKGSGRSRAPNNLTSGPTRDRFWHARDRPDATLQWGSESLAESL